MIKSIVTRALIFSSLFVGSTYAVDLNSSLQQCAQIASSTERLACYDNLANSSKKADATAKTKVIPAPAIEPPVKPENNVDEFGDHHLKKDKKPDELERVQFTVAKVSYSAKKKLKLTFENGQRWHQTDTESLRLQAGDKVELFKGAWSAVYLKKVGYNRKIRVKRVK
ncbi:hypothetical protein LP316_03145 [Thalassotalea sp. LPB0316]|uniref:hypothetical protein n=1 Tax=Thalassotalea sp. LPB0316 TaxID=2769490 RepID=UPI0018684DE1|nr:hypothetical protein [Thalassotalea sp. LPB0316]QOL26315.1 hypothetical protein LP316_03145 [Thalassotalea sp. LPB0316]